MKVFLYARVSSTAQDVDLSIGAQLKALHNYSDSQGWEVVNEYSDEAESGKTIDRPVFRRMIADALSGSLGAQKILVWKLNRFSRNRKDSIIQKSLLRKHGVDVVSINEPVDSTPSGFMLEGIIETVDEFYSATLAQDVTRGMREAASRGFWINSHTPYGYKRIKVQDGPKQRNNLELDEERSQVVTSIFGMAEAGIGTKQIAERQNGDGVPSPAGKRWGRSRIHAILTNSVYKGTLVFGESGEYHRLSGLDPVVVNNAFPSIISQARFDSVQTQLRSRAPARSHPRRASSSYLLSGLLHCGVCDARMVGKSAKSGRYHYYVCGTSDRSGTSTCSARPVAKELVEQAVLARLLDVILNEPNLERLIKLTNEELRSSQRSAEATLRVIEQEISEINSRLGRLYNAIETSSLELSDIAPRIRQLRNGQSEMETGRATASTVHKQTVVRLVDRDAVLTHIRDVKSMLSAGTPGERKVFVNGLVKRLTITDKIIEIEYRLPLPPGEINAGDDGVLPTTLFGGPNRTKSRTFNMIVALS